MSIRSGYQLSAPSQRSLSYTKLNPQRMIFKYHEQNACCLIVAVDNVAVVLVLAGVNHADLGCYRRKRVSISRNLLLHTIVLPLRQMLTPSKSRR